MQNLLRRSLPTGSVGSEPYGSVIGSTTAPTWLKSLKAGTFSGSWKDCEKTGQGLEAWEWVEKKASRQAKAVDVALYSIQGLPKNCKKKA